MVSYFNRIGKPVNAELSDSYFHHQWKNKIIYSPMGNWFELGYQELEADVATFKVLANDFGRDSKTIFWKYTPFSAANDSFRLDEQGIPRDNVHVYLDGAVKAPSIIEGADPESYERLLLPNEQTIHYWGIDKNAVFLNGEKLNVDRNSFQLLTNSFAMDASSIYQIVSDPYRYAGTRGSAVLEVREKNDGSPIKILSEYYLQMGNTILGLKYGEFVMSKFDRIDTVELTEDSIKVNGVLLFQ